MNKVVLPKKAFKYLFVLILILVLAVGVFFLLKYIGEKKKEDNFKTLISRDNKEDFARNLINTINGLKDENGRYPIHIECNKATTECTTIYSNHEGPVAVWTLYKAYKKYGDIEFLVALREDLENYTNREKFPVFQNIFWNCSLLEEIILDEEIESDIREGARELCFKGVENPDLVLPYSSSQDYSKNVIDKIYSGEINISGSVKKNNPLSAEDYKVEALAVYASEYISKSKINQDETTKKDNINKAYFFINEAYKTYSEEIQKEKYFSESTKCLLGKATFDIFKNSNDLKYLDVSSNFYSPDNILGSESLKDKIICKKFFKDLYSKYFYESVYNKDLEVSKHILENSYDLEGSSSFVYGKGLLFSNYEDKIFYDIRYNNLFLGMYLYENN